MESPIVTTDWMESRILEPSVKVIEVSAEPTDNRYREKHIPGAIWFHWKNLCWHDTDRQFVTPEKLAERLGAVGISDEDTLVLCGDPVQYGTYAFWALTMAGHPDIRIIDGAKVKWLAENRPVASTSKGTEPVDYEVQSKNEWMRLGRENVRDNLDNDGRFLLDVRSPEEYSGERVMELGKFDHGAERGGRIPGAKHLFFKELLNDDDTFKSPEELTATLKGVGADSDKADEIVAYCRLSHRATLAWTAMTYILGWEGVKIYDGSWTEWGSIVGYPVEK
ncbi:MAG: sulfurtransferase [Rhodospirillaceae bacterium]|jgi:thiosulfate/3-mercaptopyruvate sulfurtransferase|nr:sulfurtransferase [Rhodospirillaceae bacterium]